MIFPAIDIMNGGCVRLLKGNFSDRINYDVSPFEMAKRFSAAGAEWIHIVDLDGAKDGKQAQSNLIIEIAQSCGISIQTGGGIRELNHVKKLIENGVKRVVIGSLAVTNPDKVKSWIRELPNDSICIALDVNINERGIPYPAIRGWTEPNEKTLMEYTVVIILIVDWRLYWLLTLKGMAQNLVRICHYMKKYRISILT